MKPYILTLTGPSCSGKTTLEGMLRERGFAPIKSTTTRPMRAGEVNGKSYDFITREQFAELRDAGGFVEHVEFNGNLYGATVAEVQSKAATGQPIVIVAEPHGAAQIADFCRRSGWESAAVFITNPLDVILKRYLARSMQDKPADYDKWLDQTVSRLNVMMTTEKAWIVELDKYDLYIPEFNEENGVAIASHLTDMVQQAKVREYPILTSPLGAGIKAVGRRHLMLRIA